METASELNLNIWNELIMVSLQLYQFVDKILMIVVSLFLFNIWILNFPTTVKTQDPEWKLYLRYDS